MAHPMGAMFEQPFAYDDSVRDHRRFQDALKESGCEVLLLKDVLKSCNTPETRSILEDCAMKSLTYRWAEDFGDTSEYDYFVGDEYKRQIIEKASNKQLADFLLLHPTVHLSLEPKNTGITTNFVACEPLGNIVFTRDQQITTNCGIVMGRMSNHQRHCETTVLKAAWQILSHSPITIKRTTKEGDGDKEETPITIQVRLAGEIPEPYTLEGGDFLQQFNLSLCGAGYRTVEGSSLYLMRKGLLCKCETGASSPANLQTNKEGHIPYYHAVVRDGFDHNQERIHLDCVLAFLDESTALIDETVLKDRRRRYVDLYECSHGTSLNEFTGAFKLVQCQIPLDEFLESQGVKLIKIKHEQQLAYGVNVLSCGGGDIIGVCKEAVDRVNSVIQEDDERRGKINCKYVEFKGVTSMYGSAHCASQAIYREPMEEGTDTTGSFPFSHVEMKPFDFDCVLNVPSNLEKMDLTVIGGLSSPSNSLLNTQDVLIDEMYEVFRCLTLNGLRVRFVLHPFSVSYFNSLPGRNIVSLGESVFITESNESLACFATCYLKEHKGRQMINTSSDTRLKGLEKSVYVNEGQIVCNSSKDFSQLGELFGAGKVRMSTGTDESDFTVVGNTLICEKGSQLPDSVLKLEKRIEVSIPVHRRVFGVGIRDVIASL